MFYKITNILISSNVIFKLQRFDYYYYKLKQPNLHQTTCFG